MKQFLFIFSLIFLVSCSSKKEMARPTVYTSQANKRAQDFSEASGSTLIVPRKIIKNAQYSIRK